MKKLPVAIICFLAACSNVVLAQQNYVSVNESLSQGSNSNHQLLAPENYTVPLLNDYGGETNDARAMVDHILFGKFDELRKPRSGSSEYNVKMSIVSTYVGYVEAYSEFCQEFLPLNQAVITTTTTERTVNGFGRVLSEEEYVSNVLEAHPQLSDKYLQFKRRGAGLLYPGRHTPTGDPLADKLVHHDNISSLFQAESCNSLAIVQLGENLYRLVNELDPIQSEEYFLLELHFDPVNSGSVAISEIDDVDLLMILGNWELDGYPTTITQGGEYSRTNRGGRPVGSGSWNFDPFSRKLTLIASDGHLEWSLILPDEFDLSRPNLRYIGRVRQFLIAQTGEKVLRSDEQAFFRKMRED